MTDFVISLSKKQQAKVHQHADQAAMIIGYCLDAEVIRLFPVPDKQACEFAKLLQRYKEECHEKAPGYETEAWNTLHNRPTANSLTDFDKRNHDAAN